MMLTADLKFVQGSCQNHKLMVCCEALKEANMIVVVTCALIQPNVKP